jgi:hypothetical protein
VRLERPLSRRSGSKWARKPAKFMKNQSQNTEIENNQLMQLCAVGCSVFPYEKSGMKSKA